MEFSINMLVHVVAGSLAVLAGALALLTKKGAKSHRQFGKVFLLSMIVMAIEGALIAYLKPMMISVLAGVFTVYLVATGFAAVKTPAGKLSQFDYFAPILALGVAIAGSVYGVLALNHSTGLKDGFSADAYFFFAILATAAFALDIRMLVRRGISGAHRIARHLWRMCFALYIAVGSLFSQGAKVFPESVQASPLLGVPENIVFLLMLLWLVKVLFFKNKSKTKAATETVTSSA
jgi:uncharacterized membrane protein